MFFSLHLKNKIDLARLKVHDQYFDEQKSRIFKDVVADFVFKNQGRFTGKQQKVLAELAELELPPDYMDKPSQLFSGGGMLKDSSSNVTSPTVVGNGTTTPGGAGTTPTAGGTAG